MRTTADICVVGGGPSGSTFARHLARLGHDVVLLERRQFPRPQIGEAISPGIWKHLELTGVTDDLFATGVAIRTSATVRWGNTPRAGSDAPPHVVVDRGRFDQLLIEAARRAGVRVVHSAQVSSCSPPDGGRVRVAANRGSVTVEARFVADATGRRGCLPGVKRLVGAPTVALYAYWRATGPRVLKTWVQAGPSEWLWAAALPDARYSVVVFIDAETMNGRRSATERGLPYLYRDLVERSGVLLDLRNPHVVSDVTVCDASVRADRNPIGKHFIKLGDCSLALDPLSATGVERALLTGFTGSRAVHTILARPEQLAWACDFYAGAERSAESRHTVWAGECYAEHREHAEHDFWRRRATGVRPVVRNSPQIAIRDVLDHRVRLSDGTVIKQSPCLIGDLVESRLAVFHPSLDRPVAFLGDVAVAPLLATIGSSTIRELIASWSSRLSPGASARVAGWLYANGVIVPA